MTDLVSSLQEVLLQDAGTLANIDSNKVKEAVDYFEKEIHSKLQLTISDETVKEYLEVLNLPFWKYRCSLYEVWATMHTIDDFEDFDVSFNVGATMAPTHFSMIPLVVSINKYVLFSRTL
ncbi:MAG: hypothetical protein LM590_04400 [Thermofilum sp.]|nr:hypothetical protein [Thermofilum sp.]